MHEGMKQRQKTPPCLTIRHSCRRPPYQASLKEKRKKTTPYIHENRRLHSELSVTETVCLDRWTASLDSGRSLDVVYFDNSKAFDKVKHRLLMIKLKAYGIDVKLHTWLEAYLHDRKQRVVVGNAKSSWL